MRRQVMFKTINPYKKESIKTVGQSIPIYARTENGKKFLEMRLKKIGGEKPKKDNPDLPHPLI